MKSRNRKLFHTVIAIIGLAFVSSGSSAFAQQAQSQVMNTTTSDTQEAPKLSSGELDSLVAPIALYPDPLLAQTLAASTYPLEIIQLQQWMDRNKNLQGKALADAVAKQSWDPSVQGLVEFPDVVQRMAGNVQWTTDLGNAFLAQQSDVMDAVQRMRAKAQGTGNLKTSSQSVVKTETVSSGKQVIQIEQANPDVVYVPSYDPTVVYGPAPVEYPYYPYTYPGYVPGTALAWGAGIALGAAAWGAWGGHWGNCDWNGGNVNINNNNNFNRNYNKNVNRNVTGQGKATGSTIRNTGEMLLMATEIPPINLADAVRVAPVVPVVRAALVVPDDPVELVVRAALVVPEDPAELAVRAALVVPEDPVELAVRVALVVPEDPGSWRCRWRWWCRKTRRCWWRWSSRGAVVLENPAVPVELIVPVEAVLVQDHRPALLAVALRTKSVIAAHHPDQVPLLAVEEDLAAAVAETTREPAAAEAVIAWAAADTVAVVAEAAVTEPAAVAEDVAVVAEDAAVAAEDAEDKGTVDEEKTNEIKNRYYDFAENFPGRFCDPYFLFVKIASARCAIGRNGCACDIAARPKTIRHTETGCRRPCSGRDEF